MRSRKPLVSWIAYLSFTTTKQTFAFVPSFGSSSCFPTKLDGALSMSTKTVLVPIADGSEEIETTCITDTLTRFGADVTVASVQSSLICKMSRGIKIQADCFISEAATKEWDLIALPGGMPGAEHLRDSKELTELLVKQKEGTRPTVKHTTPCLTVSFEIAKKAYGAVCAAPAVVLATHGLLEGTATCYPAPVFREKLTGASDDAVVNDGIVTTSQGPGTSLAFALALGERLFGKEKRDEIAKQMLVK